MKNGLSFTRHAPRGCHAAGLFWTWVLLAAAAAAHAAPLTWPSTQDTAVPLPAQNAAEVRELHKTAWEAYQKAVTLTTLILDKNDAGESSTFREVGQAFVANYQFGRYAKELRLAGEPAGAEFGLRNEILQKQLVPIRDAMRQDPESSKKLAKGLAVLIKQAKAKQGVLKKVAKLIQEEKWEEAVKSLYEVKDSLDEMAIWYDGPSLADSYGPFNEALSTAQAPYYALLSKRAAARLNEQRQQELPDFMALLNACREAASQIAAGGQASVDGKPLTGPELLTHYAQEWRAVTVRAYHCRALDWAIDAENDGADRTRWNQWDAAQTAFASEMGQALVQIVASDATRVPAAEAASVHGQYLRAWSTVAALASDEALSRSMSDALDKLAAKAPEFGNEVVAYRAATSDLLRWRQRTTAAYVKSHQAGYDPLEARFQLAFVRNQDATGLFQMADAANGPRFLDPTSLIIEGAQARLLGSKVQVGDWLGVQGDPRRAISRYAGHCYAGMSFQTDTTTQVQALERDLLASDTAEPLTAEAYLAVQGARQGVWTKVAGEVTSFELQALLTRMSTLEEADLGLLRLGRFSSESLPERLKQAILHCELKADWLANPYFFVSLK